MTTYTKLRDGSWGLRVNSGQTVKSGQSVTVTKKSGETKAETVGKVLWTGNGVTLATIAQSNSNSNYSPRSSRGTWSGCRCGSIEDQPRASDCASCRFDNE